MPEDDRDRPDLRVSDAERQQVVDRLSRATGDGLLTLDEFADAAGQAYAAVTRSQLDAVARDLNLPVVAPIAEAPAVRTEPAAAEATEAAPKRRWVVAIMGGEDRRGKWRVSRRTGAFAFMGGVDLDLRDAVLDGEDIEITAWAIMGGVTVIVPEGIPVESSGFMLMGGRSNRIKDVPPVPGAPIIRVRGYGMWGGVDVRSKPPRRSEGEEGEPASVVDVANRAAERAMRHAERHLQGIERHQERVLRHLPVPPPPLPPPSPPMPEPVVVIGNRPVEAQPRPQPAGGLVTVVCTDIVGSTRYADTLGDQRWRGILQAHNALVREQLAGHGGTEVKTSGDGFLVTFPSARRAVQFAVRVQEAMADYRAGHPETPLQLRVGVHAGDVERDGDDLVGRNVSLACRLCDAAAPGEVLVSSVVADLADSASDLGFGEGRQLQLAGIERAVVAHPAARR